MTARRIYRADFVEHKIVVAEIHIRKGYHPRWILDQALSGGMPGPLGTTRPTRSERVMIAYVLRRQHPDLFASHLKGNTPCRWAGDPPSRKGVTT